VSLFAPEPEELLSGLVLHRNWFDQDAQMALVHELRGIIQQAPLFTPVMPKSGTPFSVRMTNCGPLGWVSDIKGYRYQPHHPVTGAAWPTIPLSLSEAWEKLADFAAPPEACLVKAQRPHKISPFAIGRCAADWRSLAAVLSWRGPRDGWVE
jgi:DNA oxidative demethylase